MNVTQAHLDEAATVFCMPVTLLINFSLFQYLLMLYYSRRREYHGFLLLLCAFLGFATLIPFASSHREAAEHLNNVSELASTITFLIQITMVSRDVSKKIRIPRLRHMLLASELLTFLLLLMLLANVISIAMHENDFIHFDVVDNVAENVSLTFIFASRFYFLYASRGWRHLLTNKKLEVFAYALFFTHEYPFVVLEAETGLNWEPVQAFWHRATIAMCIGLTIREKIRNSFLSNNSTARRKTASVTAATDKSVPRRRSLTLAKAPTFLRSPTKEAPTPMNIIAVRPSVMRTVLPVDGTPQITSEHSGETMDVDMDDGSPGTTAKSMTHIPEHTDE